MSDYINQCIIWYDDSSTQLYADYLHVTRYDDDGTENDGCFAYIGHVINGPQRVNYGKNASYRYIRGGTLFSTSQNSTLLVLQTEPAPVFHESV